MPDRIPGKGNIDPDYPIALLPVRLQTRYIDDHLRVRVLPDTIHAAAHDDRLIEREIEAGTAYWLSLIHI